MARTKSKQIIPASMGVNKWSSGHTNNRNDCVVRAFAVAKGVTYPESLEVFKGLYIPTNGVFWRDAYRVFKQHGLLPKGVFGTTSHAKCFVNIVKNNSDAVPHFKGCTVEKMLPALQEGKFIVCIREHALAVIDGDVIDYGPVNAGASVVAVFELQE